MNIIDGSQGEGGGQIFRTALTLSMCTHNPVRIINIRAGRKKPGLLRQHLTCLNAAVTISDAQVLGAELGATDVTFIPGKVKSGNYRFSVGSAGSTTLVFQTVFLPLALVGDKSEVIFEGGTHNGMAPSFDFIQLCYLPAVKKMGFNANCELHSYGFYPAGGGRWTATIYPVDRLEKLALSSHKTIKKIDVTAISANIPEHINDRELAWVQNKCNWGNTSYCKDTVQSHGPGNILSIRLNFSDYHAVFEALGERGRSAERVAELAISAVERFVAAGVPVCEYLADQLLVPMVMASGGEFLTSIPSDHVLTNARVVDQILGTSFTITKANDLQWFIAVL